MFIPEDILRAAILEKYGSQANFAKIIKYSEAQISRAIKSQSPRFLVACKKAGIDINAIIVENEEHKSGNSGKKISKLNKKIAELEKLNDSQQRIIESQETLLKYYKEIVDGIKKSKSK